MDEHGGLAEGHGHGVASSDLRVALEFQVDKPAVNVQKMAVLRLTFRKSCTWDG